METLRHNAALCGRTFSIDVTYKDKQYMIIAVSSPDGLLTHLYEYRPCSGYSTVRSLIKERTISKSFLEQDITFVIEQMLN